MVDSIYKTNPNFVLQVGDMVQTGYVDMEWARYFSTGEELFRSIPVLPTPGNHEYYGGSMYSQDSEESAEKYLEAYTLPGNESYYAYNISNAHFISLDFSSANGAKSKSVQVNQMVWLDKHLSILNQSRDKFDWLFVSFHYPIQSTGQSHENLYDEILKPLLEKYNLTVDFYLVGHIHQYERLYLSNAKSWEIVSGGGGAEVEQSKLITPVQGSKYLELSHSFCTFDINGTSLYFKALYLKGGEFDSMSLTKETGGL